jgi:2-succinyl-5-enolpyruvyl-6-hydroxy-3-cyclohexene-1-carboxylate synthase
MSDPNLNHLCARIAVEECIRRGCRTVIVCPGSRSAPLAVAAARWSGLATAGRDGGVDVLVAHDERGAAFLALGAARVTGCAAIVITTSGTAVANLLPAAVEASMDGIPMLLFTADRPPELHGCGANQSVPQSGMLASVTRESIDVACPDEPGSTPLDALDAAARAWDLAHGSVPGPVHVNWRFREPLAPVATQWSLERDVAARLEQWESSGVPWAVAAATRSVDAWGMAAAGDLDALCARMQASRRGVVVAGGARSPADAAQLAQVARALPWPVIADITSGLRSEGSLPNVVHHADLALCATRPDGPAAAACDDAVAALRPDMILRIGGRIASKRLQQWMDDAASAGCALAVAGDGAEPMDPSRCASVRVRVSAGALAARLASGAKALAPSAVSDAWLRADAAVARALEECCVRGEPAAASHATEPAAARTALREAHAAGAIAMLSSSMPVRDADMHADRARTPWCIANRGASGIDGIVATAVGACRATRRPVLLLIGDVAALHDLSSWSLLRHLPAPMCVVVVNNDGGGIFRFLPIAGHASVFSPWFDSPHGLDFAGAAAMFALPYVAAASDGQCAHAVRDALREVPAGAGSCSGHRAHIVEVRADAARVVPDHRRIQESCVRAVRDALAQVPAQGSVP